MAAPRLYQYGIEMRKVVAPRVGLSKELECSEAVCYSAGWQSRPNCIEVGLGTSEWITGFLICRMSY
jgi:hypothetical protein